jgi:cytidylate kinase
LIITIDGPAGSGKSTIAKNLAARLGFTFLDTGATYRAVALAADRTGLDESAAKEIAELASECRIEFQGSPEKQQVFLDGEDVTSQIRTPEVSSLASRISTLPGVRKALVDLQRMIAAEGNVVAEGRDTGSVVFPGADLKIYLDASIKERARRRAGDWEEGAPLEIIEADIAARDERDRTRTDSPLVIPDGAYLIGSTDISAEEVLGLIIGKMKELGLHH